MINQSGAKLWPQFAADLQAQSGIDFGYEQSGGFQLLMTEKEVENRASQVDRLQRQSGDIGVRMLDHAELARRIDAIGPTVAGASYCPLDGAVNPLNMLRALRAAFVKSGGEILTGTKVERISGAQGGFSVMAGERTVDARRLVIAAGLATRELAASVDIDMPIFPQRGQIIVTERVQKFINHPNSAVRQLSEGTVLLGSTQENVGFDKEVDVPLLARIARRATTIFPCLSGVNVTRTWGCLRVMTPDGSPIYERSPTFPDAFAVAAHSGITLAPHHVGMLARDILDGGYGETLQAFSKARFGGDRSNIAISEH